MTTPKSVMSGSVENSGMSSVPTIFSGASSFNKAKPPSSPVFVKKLNSFSEDCSEQLVLHYYQYAMNQILTSAGLDKMQAKSIMVQLDFLLTDQQHQHLHHAKLLTASNIKQLEELAQKTKFMVDKQENTKAAITIQRHMRGWIVRKHFGALKREEKSVLRIRRAQFQVILNAETNYLAFLETIQEEYVRPVSMNPPSYMASVTATKYLASNIDQLMEHHRWFLNELKRIRDQTLFPLKMPLGELILEVQVKIRSLYLAYGSQFVHSLETARYLRAVSSTFQTLGNQGEVGPPDASLEELLKLPLQYISYLAKKLRTIHDCSIEATQKETLALGQSIGKIESIGFALNEILMKQEDPEVYNDIKNTLLVELTIEGLEDPLWGTSQNRKFLKEGSARVRRRKGQGKACQIFLFNDVIIIAEKCHDSLKFHTKMYPNELLQLDDRTSKLVIRRVPPEVDGEPFSETWIFKNHKSEVEEWKEVLHEFMDHYERNRVFGVSLDKIVETENNHSKIPFVLQITIDYIKEYGMNTEGIFRVPGELQVIDNFKRSFDRGNLLVDFRGCTVHDVAALFKLFLRELPEPLFLYSNFHKMIDIQKEYNSNKDVGQYRSALVNVISALPLSHGRVLSQVMQLYYELALNHATTKMGASNLAMVIVPNIIRPEIQTIDATMNGLILGRLIEYLIQHWQSIWNVVTTKNPELKVGQESTKEGTKRPNRYSMEAFDPHLDELPFPRTLGLEKVSTGSRIDFSLMSPTGKKKKRKFKTHPKSSPRRRMSSASPPTSPKVVPISIPARSPSVDVPITISTNKEQRIGRSAKKESSRRKRRVQNPNTSESSSSIWEMMKSPRRSLTHKNPK